MPISDRSRLSNSRALTISNFGLLFSFQRPCSYEHQPTRGLFSPWRVRRGGETVYMAQPQPSIKKMVDRRNLSQTGSPLTRDVLYYILPRDEPLSVYIDKLRVEDMLSDNPSRPFETLVPHKPAGDQPAAIEELQEGLSQKKSKQTLLGVTGSGNLYRCKCNRGPEVAHSGNGT